MSKEPLSLFHEHLLLFLQDDLHRKRKSEGWDERLDLEVRTYRDLLSSSMRAQGPLRLQEIIEKYQHLFIERGPVHLEHKILEAFPEQEMKRLGLPPLRMYRGLPRLFHKGPPALLSKIQPAFSHLPSLKQAALAKPLYSMYAHFPLPKDAKVAILAHTSAASFGEEIMCLFKQAFSTLNVRLVLFGGEPCNLRELRGFDLLLQVGSEHEEISEAVKRILEMDDLCPVPKYELLRRSAPYNAISLHVHTMGLHFLERGIFLKSFRSVSLTDLESVSMLNWLFGDRPTINAPVLEGKIDSSLDDFSLQVSKAIPAAKKSSRSEPFFSSRTGAFIIGRSLEPERVCPGPQEIGEYRRQRRFFLFRLSSQEGVFVYLHALLKSLEWDDKEIDICIPDAQPLVDYLCARKAAGKPPLEKAYKVGKIVLCLGREVASIEIQPQGKRVRILSPETLSDADISRLLLFSEDFAGATDSEGIFDAIAANKGFFFDPCALSRPFLKDLVAFAENRIAAHRSTLSILRLFAKVYEHRFRPEKSEWVDEISIQCEEKESLLETAEKIGFYLQDPDALAGFKKLNHLIAKEHNCNGFLLQMVQRAVCHRRRPQIAHYEEEAVSKFILNQMPLAHLSEHLRDAFLS